MSKILANLSGKSRQEIEETISKLEELSGFPSEDVRHLSASLQSLRAKLTQLNLDPDDTTGEELYHALISRYDTDAKRIDKTLGLSSDSGLAERIAKAEELVNHSIEKREIWCLKTSAAKQIIKSNPPKKLMKRLHYRSVESLLKREDIAVIFIGADLDESASWHKKVETALAKLSTTAYELRPGKVVNLDAEKFSNCDCDKAVMVNGVVGGAAVCPSLRADVPALSIALLLVDGLESLSENSLTHRLHNSHPTLSWWIGTDHLSLADVDERPVSLNFKDVVQDHLAGNDYEARSFATAQHEFWKGLMSSYKKHLDELPEEVAAATRQAGEQLLPRLEMVPELAEMEI